MKYEIRRLALGCRTSLSIESTDFTAIKNARDSLLGLLQIEEDYDILIGNYLDLETRMLGLTMDVFVHMRSARIEFDADARLVNRLAINLLASARAYIDHTKHNVSALSGRLDSPTIDGYFSFEYDNSQPYRVVEALRNYTQHYGQAVYGLNYPMKWQDSNGIARNELVCSFVPYLSIEELRNDRRFKRKILDELKSPDDQSNEVPLLPLIRGYVGSLSSVHDKLRQLYGVRQSEWSETLDHWTNQFFAKSESSVAPGVAAVAIEETGGITDEIHLGVEFKERVAYLQHSNRKLPNLQKVRITN